MQHVSCLGQVLLDGVDISQLDLAERYALILNTGIDMFIAFGCSRQDLSLLEDVGFQRYFPEYVAEARESLITEERLTSPCSA